MPQKYKPKTRLDQLEYSPNENPLLKGLSIETRTKKLVKTQLEVPDLNTGETHSSNIFITKELDESQFVKVFSEGIKATYDLTLTAHRVFQAILAEYESTPMTSGYVDCIYLAWFDNGLCGKSIGMIQATYLKGFRELLDKGFMSPRSPNTYWVNPALFFKGDRVRFINEYTVKRQKELKKDLESTFSKS